MGGVAAKLLRASTSSTGSAARPRRTDATTVVVDFALVFVRDVGMMSKGGGGSNGGGQRTMASLKGEASEQ